MRPKKGLPFNSLSPFENLIIDQFEGMEEGEGSINIEFVFSEMRSPQGARE
jgi:hypothetical protein